MSTPYYRRITWQNLALPVACLVASLFAMAWWELRTAQPAKPPTTATGLVGPVVREIITSHGTLLEIRTPYDPYKLGIPAERICFVWRDGSSTQTSLDCPPDTVIH